MDSGTFASDSGRKSVISRGDSIAGIIFGVLVCVMFIYAPEFMGAWMKSPEGEIVSIPIFNMEIWHRILPLMLLSVGAGLIDELVKLIAGHYNVWVLWTNVIANSVSIVATILIFRNQELWNSHFLDGIAQATGEDMTGQVMCVWNEWMAGGKAAHMFILLIVFACVLEMGITVYKTVRYGIMSEKGK